MIGAIILAAGQATRFGDRKQLARIAGRPLLQHVIDRVSGSRAGDIVLVLGAYADDIRSQIDPDRTRIVVNPDYAEGMSTSIIAGVKALDAITAAAIIVLGDQPFVATATFDRLIATYEEQHATIVVPTYRGLRGNPVLVDRSLFPEMLRLRGDVGCRAIFGEHAAAIVKIEVDDEGVVTDIDTAEDLPKRT